MIIYTKYINSEEHTWYDSSNVVYSEYFDRNAPSNPLKLIFKNGRTYLYKDVKTEDYLAFRESESSGKGVNQYIVRKYKPVRLPDADVEELEKKRKALLEDTRKTDEAFTNLAYRMEYNPQTKGFRLILGDNIVFEDFDNTFSILKLFKCMNIRFGFEESKNPEIGKQPDIVDNQESTKNS